MKEYLLASDFDQTLSFNELLERFQDAEVVETAASEEGMLGSPRLGQA